MFPYRFVSIISWWVFYSEGVTYCRRKVVGCMLKYLQDANGIHLITSTGRGAIKMKSKLQTNNTNKQTKNTIELAPHLNHHVTFCDFMLLLKKRKKSVWQSFQCEWLAKIAENDKTEALMKESFPGLLLKKYFLLWVSSVRLWVTKHQTTQQAFVPS